MLHCPQVQQNRQNMPDSIELCGEHQISNLIPTDMRCLFLREKAEFWWKTVVPGISIKPLQNAFCLLFQADAWVWWKTAVNKISIKLTKKLRRLLAVFLHQMAKGRDLFHQNEHEVWWKIRNSPVSIKFKASVHRVAARNEHEVWRKTVSCLFSIKITYLSALAGSLNGINSSELKKQVRYTLPRLYLK